MKENWKDICGFEGLYQISDYGRIKSIRRNKILTSSIHKKGYLHCGLFKEGKRTQRFIHRMVAEAFIPNPENKPCINHKDCNPANNKVENLEWCTHKENNHHKNHELKRKISLLIFHLKKDYKKEEKLIQQLINFKSNL